MLQPACDGLHFRFSLRKRYTRFQAPDHIEKEGSSVLKPVFRDRPRPLVHRHRHPEIRRNTYIHASEARRNDSDHGESASIQRDRGSDDVGVTTKFLPKFVAKDGHRMTIRRGIFLRQKRAAENRFHFEQIEIIAGDD